MSNPYVLASLLVLSAGLLALAFYGIKRYFDDRAETRLMASGTLISEMAKLSLELIEQRKDIREALAEHRSHVDANAGIVRDRLGVFESALKEFIAQTANRLAEANKDTLDTKAKIAGALIKQGRRMPTP